MTALAARGLVAGYSGGPPVLDGVDLSVPSGALAAVLGPSGCGKTTLLRVLAGFHRLSAGEVRLGGTVVAGDGLHLPPERRRIGVVPQEGALFPHLTVAGNVGFGLRRGARRRSRVEELLELVGLAGFGDRMPAELSGGQQQRVAVARALAPEPALVLLDEPFSALDAGLRAEIRADVRAALHATGATAVLVTHDQEEALGIADLVAVLRDGRVVQSGSPTAVYTEPADLGVATFVGEAVLLAAAAEGSQADTAALGRLPLATPAHGEGVVMLRPEQLRLSTAAANGAPVARVSDTIFHGHDATVLLQLAEHRLRARVHGRLTVKPGDTVTLHISGPARFFPTTAGRKP
jgi:iron(III) transport system ATP-binding protein